MGNSQLSTGEGQKVIGVELETKYYRIGRHTLKMIPITELKFPEADRVLKAIGSITEAKDATLLEGLARVYGAILEPVLKMEHSTERRAQRWVERIVWFVTRTTPLRILGRQASVNQVGEIINDFFVINFGSTRPSSPLSVSSILNLPRAAQRTPSMTSSSH